MGTETVRGKIRSVGAFIESVKAAGETGERRYTGWANTKNMDRVREVIEPKAFKSTLDLFKKNPIMLWMHDTREPIGHYDSLEVKDQGLWVSGVVGEGWDVADRTWKQIEQGHLKAMSIGFREIDGEVKKIPDEEGNEHEVYHITDLELYEISVVSVPANREALFTIGDGKLLDVTIVPEELENLTDDELLAECTKRGLIAAGEEPAPVQPNDVQIQDPVEDLSKTLEAHFEAKGDEVPAPAPQGDVPKSCGQPSIELLAVTGTVYNDRGEKIGDLKTGLDGSLNFLWTPPQTKYAGIEDVEQLQVRVEILEKRNRELIGLIGEIMKVQRDELAAKREDSKKRGNGSITPGTTLATV